MPLKIDDRDRVEAFLARRDESSFRALYREHTPVLYRLAFRFLGAQARGDVDDVVQETWIRAVRRLPTFEWRSSLRTWLVGILVNCARETTRRRRTLPDGGNHRRCSAPDAAIDLEDAITRLAEKARAVFCLHDIEGYTHEEIGRLLGISEGTSKSQLAAARRRLREHLGGKS